MKKKGIMKKKLLANSVIKSLNLVNLVSQSGKLFAVSGEKKTKVQDSTAAIPNSDQLGMSITGKMATSA